MPRASLQERTFFPIIIGKTKNKLFHQLPMSGLKVLFLAKKNVLAGQLAAKVGNMRHENKKRVYGGYRKPLILLVGMARFERAASASRTLRSSQAEPHPVEKGNISEAAHFGK